MYQSKHGQERPGLILGKTKVGSSPEFLDAAAASGPFIITPIPFCIWIRSIVFWGALLNIRPFQSAGKSRKAGKWWRWYWSTRIEGPRPYFAGEKAVDAVCMQMLASQEATIWWRPTREVGALLASACKCCGSQPDARGRRYLDARAASPLQQHISLNFDRSYLLSAVGSFWHKHANCKFCCSKPEADTKQHLPSLQYVAYPTSPYNFDWTTLLLFFLLWTLIGWTNAYSQLLLAWHSLTFGKSLNLECIWITFSSFPSRYTLLYRCMHFMVLLAPNCIIRIVVSTVNCVGPLALALP